MSGPAGSLGACAWDKTTAANLSCLSVRLRVSTARLKFAGGATDMLVILTSFVSNFFVTAQHSAKLVTFFYGI
jgi:hypothetical protein